MGVRYYSFIHRAIENALVAAGCVPDSLALEWQAAIGGCCCL